jgi:hypothetical protein
MARLCALDSGLLTRLCFPCRLSPVRSQVPCSNKGGVVTRVDSYRSSGGGWVRLVFKNVNGTPLEKVEISKVRQSIAVAINCICRCV